MTASSTRFDEVHEALVSLPGSLVVAAMGIIFALIERRITFWTTVAHVMAS
jgi:hypothetical protein